MKVTLIADARSPTARGWFDSVVAEGHELQVLSTYPADPHDVPGALQLLPTIPVLRGLMPIRVPVPRPSERPPRGADVPFAAGARSMSPAARRLRNLRLLSEMMCLPMVKLAITRSVRDFQPDVVHALRIPYEGMFSEAALRNRRTPFLVSIWGNDLTMFAAPSRLFTRATKRVLSSADALHCDCGRDVRLARTLGYVGPSIVLPGCGGLDRSVFPGTAPPVDARARLGISSKGPIIFDPRASRGYTRHDIFFAALPAVLSEFPEAVVVAVGIDGEDELRNYARKLAIDRSIIFLPKQNSRQMAELYAAAELTISATEHDGTPNSVLEAMACGSFPIVSKLESLREWIENGRNGFLVDLTPSSFASAIVRALRDGAMRARAAARNRELIENRATREVVGPAITRLYLGALASRHASVPSMLK